jgi:hypothetical protein
VQAAFAMLVAIFVPAQPMSAEDVVRRATSNFEYRDFEKVIELLEPLITTPTLPPDHPLMITAYRLLGVSRHVTGDVAGARREFSLLLQADPEHQLDRFKIPPQVIETFEALRREMKDRLDQILRERGRRPKEVPPPGTLIPIEVPARFEMLLPLGLPQFFLDQDGLGLLFLATQLLGVAANIAGFFIADSATIGCTPMDVTCELTGPATPEDQSRLDAGRVVWGVGLLVLGASYGTSVVLGLNDLPEYRESRLNPAPGTKPAGITFQLRF